MSRLQHLANVVVAQLNTVVVMAGSLVVTPTILHGLGDSGYGGWLLINSFIGYMRFLDLGATAGTVKFAAGARERGDRDDLAAVLNTSSAIFVGVAVTVTLATLLLLVLLPRLYPTVATDQMSVILMLGGALTLEMMFRPFVATLRMRSLFYVYDSIEIATYLTFKFGFVIYFASRGSLSYQTLATLTLTETVVRLVLVVGASLVTSQAARRINPLGARRNMVRKIARIGVATSIMMVADVFRFQLDAGVIGYFRPESPESISIFGLGARLATLSYSVIGVIPGVLVPRFSGLSETGNKDGTAQLLRRTSLLTGLGASLILVNLFVLGPNFLGLWLNKPWTSTSGTVLRILIPAYYLALIAAPGHVLLLGQGKLRGLTIFTVAEAAVNVVLSVLLVRRFGIIGVAVGTALPLAFFHGVLFPALLHREIDLPPAQYWRIHLPAIGVGVIYAIAIGGLAFVPLPTYARFVGLGAGTVVVFAVLVVAFIPTARDAASSAVARVRAAAARARRRSA